MAAAWLCRNDAQVAVERCGAGSMPASFKICQTVDVAIFTPSVASSPWTRRYPHPGFSCARRTTIRRIEASVRGLPGRLGRLRCA